jgi:hypothetical protein
LALFVAACSGSGGGGNDTPSTSGLSENAPVSQLSDADLNTLCTWAADYEGGPGTSLGCNITVNAPSRCVASVRASPSCAATVGDVESCVHEVRSTPCTAIGSPACLPLVACSTGG